MRVEAHGVVEAGLDVAGAVRRSAVVVGDRDGNGGVAALEVGAHGGHENAELVLGGRLDADDLTGSDHEGTHVQRGARAVRRDPGGVGGHDLLDGLHELVLGEGGHAEALSGVVHTLGVHVGAEADDAAVLGGIGLEALEDFLAVMEDARALAQRDGVVSRKATLLPLAVLVVADVAVVGGHIGKGQVCPVQVLLLDLAHERTPLRVTAAPGKKSCAHRW